MSGIGRPDPQSSRQMFSGSFNTVWKSLPQGNIDAKGPPWPIGSQSKECGRQQEETGQEGVKRSDLPAAQTKSTCQLPLHNNVRPFIEKGVGVVSGKQARTMRVKRDVKPCFGHLPPRATSGHLRPPQAISGHHVSVCMHLRLGKAS